MTGTFRQRCGVRINLVQGIEIDSALMHDHMQTVCMAASSLGNLRWHQLLAHITPECSCIYLSFSVRQATLGTCTVSRATRRLASHQLPQRALSNGCPSNLSSTQLCNSLGKRINWENCHPQRHCHPSISANILPTDYQRNTQVPSIGPAYDDRHLFDTRYAAPFMSRVFYQCFRNCFRHLLSMICFVDITYHLCLESCIYMERNASVASHLQLSRARQLTTNIALYYRSKQKEQPCGVSK